jgi:hypothetical protein
MVTLSATRADALMIYSVTPRACSQALRKAFELNWNVTRFLAGGCANPDTVLQPAGFNAAEGLITVRAFKSFEAAEQSDPDIIAYLDFIKRYAPGVRPTETFATYAYTSAGALIEVLKRAEEPLSRERIMAAATNLKKLRLPLFLPGITLSTSPDDFRPLRDGVLAQFHDGKWINLGDLVRGD